MQPQEHRSASRQSSRRVSLSCEAKLEEGQNFLDAEKRHLTGEFCLLKSHVRGLEWPTYLELPAWMSLSCSPELLPERA